jgi:hypothetical protein
MFCMCCWLQGIATEANDDYHMCMPPGLIYARAGEMRRNNKVLVLQVGAAAAASQLHRGQLQRYSRSGSGSCIHRNAGMMSALL